MLYTTYYEQVKVYIYVDKNIWEKCSKCGKLVNMVNIH